MLFAIIDRGTGVALDGDGDLVGDGADGQLTAGDNELNIGEVLAVVRELRCRQVHRIGASVDALSLSGAGEREVSFLVEIVVNADVVAGDGLLSAIIDRGTGVALDGDSDLVGDGADGQLTVLFNDELNIGKVRIGVLELLGLQAHRIGADVGALGLSGAGEGEAIRGVEVVADALNLIALDLVLFAIIDRGTGVALDGDSDLVGDGADGQLAVLTFLDDILLSFIDGSNRVLRELSGIITDLSARSTNDDIGEVCVLGSAGEAGNGLLVAVIGRGLAVCGQFNIFVVVERDDIAAGTDRDGL